MFNEKYQLRRVSVLCYWHLRYFCSDMKKSCYCTLNINSLVFIIWNNTAVIPENSASPESQVTAFYFTLIG